MEPKENAIETEASSSLEEATLALMANHDSYSASLQESNRKLCSGIEWMKNYIAEAKSLETSLTTETKRLLSKCTAGTAAGKKDLVSLKNKCAKLYSFACNNNEEPRLMRQLPLDSYIIERKNFDVHIKNYIVQKFKENTETLLQAENLYSDTSVVDEQLADGPHQEFYHQQCLELDTLEAEYSAALINRSMQNVQVKSLQAAMQVLGIWKENSVGSINGSMSSPDGSMMNTLETQLRNMAAKCAAQRAEQVVTNSIDSKQRRQYFYVQHLVTLQGLLEKRLSLDMLHLAMLQVETKLVENVCTFLGSISEISQEYCEKSQKLIKEESVVPEQQAEGKGKVADLQEQEHGSNVLADSVQLSDSYTSDAMKQYLDLNEQYLQELTTSHESLSSTKNRIQHMELPPKFKDDLWRVTVGLQKQEAEFDSTFSACTVEKESFDSYISNSQNQLWATFVVSPEELHARIQDIGRKINTQ